MSAGSPRRVRVLALALPVVVLLAMRPWCARAAGDRVAERLVKLTTWPHDAGAVPAHRGDLDDAAPAGDSRADPDPDRDNVRAPRLPPPRVPNAGGGGSRSEAGDAGAAAVPSRVYVPASTVLRIARRRSVSTTPAEGGLALHGVGGSGLRDGDIVTHINGTPVASQDAAVGVIMSALAAKAQHVSGTVLRNGKPIAVTVEVPTESQVQK